jgi:LysR family hca operon transcriptional activator
MELRHLRYFVAVAEEGSLTVAAERRLHTAQPSLSRQMRDLETEVGAELMTRSARGVELTAAGRVFLDYVRLALAQVDAAGEAARRAAHPGKKTFAVGFLRTGTGMAARGDAHTSRRIAQHRSHHLQQSFPRLG